ncbi:MAG TPA: glycosyl hydrolase family 18 protein [Candidatus Eisenbacteria bacterium]|nr:glycosyl hydrolase family 18 protein [Candidatus Eisenbacteria bacterium]
MLPRSRPWLAALIVVLVMSLAVELGLVMGVRVDLAQLGIGGDAAPSSGGSPTAAPAPLASEIQVGQEAGGLPENPGVIPTRAAEPIPSAPPPLGETELYGYLPYWQMNQAMVARLREIPVTTLALFSVSAAEDGTLDQTQLGYRRMTGDIGQELIAAARARRASVEIVFTSFGLAQNHRYFGEPNVRGAVDRSGGGHDPLWEQPRADPSSVSSTPPWKQTIPELVGLVEALGVDGINVDVELLYSDDFDGYIDFLAELRAALKEAVPKASLSVASTASMHGAVQARAAILAGVDRVFLMGYDYHWSGSQPGGSAPLDRRDGVSNLKWSIGQYASMGVPPEQTLLGLPLYGMSWPVSGPGRGAVSVGKGVAWIPANHTELLLDSTFALSRDTLELAEYFVTHDEDGWRATFFDSPDTLRSKLALARDKGFAGAGFWARGYERDLPGYVELMEEFRAGEIGREQLYVPEKPFGQ